MNTWSYTTMPNLLFIYTDQQRYDSLTMAISGQPVMPHVQRLASVSFVFDQTYCTQPVCTPSRAALTTGHWPHQSGVVTNNIPLPSTARTLVEHLPSDVATGHFGKWHLGDEIYPQHGFKEWRAIDDTYWPFYSEGRDRIRDRSSHHHWLISRGVSPWPVNVKNTLVSCPRWYRAPAGERLPYDLNRFSREQITELPESFCKPSYLADEAIDFLRRHRTEPFALYVNFFEPHHPISSPRNNQYNPADVALADGHDCLPDASVPLDPLGSHVDQIARGFDGSPVATVDEQRRAIARYWGMCSLVDTHVGRILAALDDLNLSDDTLVVFTTDHGEMMGAHGMWGKGVMYEPSVRVPMMIHLPGQHRGGRVTGPTSQIDLVPTLLDYLGLDTTVRLPGHSLRDRIEQNAPPRDVMIEWNAVPGSDGESARTLVTPDGWKLTLSTWGRHELRNLRDDPHETGNLVKQNPAQTRYLADQIAEWQRATGDACPVTAHVSQSF